MKDIIKIINFIIAVIFGLDYHMEKPNQEEIPRTIIKGPGLVSADLRSLNGRGSVMFYSIRCSIIGLDNLPYVLFVTPEFKDEDVPIDIRKNIYNVKEIIIQSTFVETLAKKSKFYPIPLWISSFKKIEYLRLEHADLDNLDYLKDLPIQELAFENVRCNDVRKAVGTIKKFKDLKEISFNRYVATDLINALRKLNLRLTVVEEFK